MNIDVNKLCSKQNIDWFNKVKNNKQSHKILI
jgi:hypothetical protein